MAGTETKRIIELTEASTVQSGDFIAVDSNARGTKKVSTDTLATSAALTAETNARAGADEQMSERMDGIEEQTALIQNPTKTLSGALCSFTDGADMPMVACTASIVPKQSGSGTPSPSNVRAISGWESVSVYVSPTEDEADGHTTTTSLGRTVYGGTAEIVGGSLTDRRQTIQFDSSSGLTFQKNTTTGNWWATAIKFDATSDNINDVLCDCLKPSNNAYNGNEAYSCRVLGGGRVYISLSSEQTSNADCQAWLAQYKPTISAVRATPQTYTLTGQEVSTLLGDNNVWADSGDVEITYRRDISIVLENLENALNGSNSLNAMMMSAPTETTAEEPTEDETEDDMR